MILEIITELKKHWKFTFAGAVIGVSIMVLLQFFNLLKTAQAEMMFNVVHPLHVLLSALVTAAMYQHHNCCHDKKQCYVPALLVVGYLGAIGIATISDCLVPYWGESILGLKDAHMHIGIIEAPLQVSLAALIGIIIAWYSPMTKFPHAGHVLLSTAATLFHIIIASQGVMSIYQYVFMVIFLFIAVWIPCCISDIIFPLLFASKK